MIHKNGLLVERPQIAWRCKLNWFEQFERGVLARFVREGERGFTERDFAEERELNVRVQRERVQGETVKGE